MRVLVRRLSRAVFGVVDNRMNEVRVARSFDYPRFPDGTTAVASYHCADDVSPLGQLSKINLTTAT